MRSIEQAMDPVSGDISPNKFMNVLKKREKNAVFYNRGPQELTDLARIGKKFIGEQVPSSGTAERNYWMNLLGKAEPLNLGVLGALAGGATGDPGVALGAASANALAGMAIPPYASSLMWNPEGWLAQGAADMTREVVPGVTREALLEALSRSSGAQGSMALWNALLGGQ